MITTIRKLAGIAALALAGAGSAQATDIELTPPAYGSWQLFDVSDLLSVSGGTEWIDIADGSALSFHLVVPTGFAAQLTVVDGGFAGDRFAVNANGTLLGLTGAAVDTQDVNVGLDFDAALADSRYSRGVFQLGAGSYTLTGLLAQSATDGGLPLNTTVGALRVEVSAVPVPPAAALMVAGLAVLGLQQRRRRLSPNLMETSE